MPPSCEPRPVSVSAAPAAADAPRSRPADPAAGAAKARPTASARLAAGSIGAGATGSGFGSGAPAGRRSVGWSAVACTCAMAASTVTRLPTAGGVGSGTSAGSACTKIERPCARHRVVAGDWVDVCDEPLELRRRRAPDPFWPCVFGIGAVRQLADLDLELRTRPQAASSRGSRSSAPFRSPARSSRRAVDVDHGALEDDRLLRFLRGGGGGGVSSASSWPAAASVVGCGRRGRGDRRGRRRRCGRGDGGARPRRRRGARRPGSELGHRGLGRSAAASAGLGASVAGIWITCCAAPTSRADARPDRDADEQAHADRGRRQRRGPAPVDDRQRRPAQDLHSANSALTDATWPRVGTSRVGPSTDRSADRGAVAAARSTGGGPVARRARRRRGVA